MYSVCAERIPANIWTIKRNAVENLSIPAAMRKELTYKFGSLVIFSHGKVQYELGCATEQMLDRFCTSLVRRLICRSWLDMSLRHSAMDRAANMMGLRADAHSCRYDSACAAETFKTVMDLGRRGKNPGLAREFILAAYELLSAVESELDKLYPGRGFEGGALNVINELCARCGAAPLDPKAEKRAESRKKTRSAAELLLAAVVGFVMLPVLL